MLRKTMTVNRSAILSARPISTETRSMCEKSMVPSLRSGVPTQTTMTSQRDATSSMSVVTESLPDARPAEMSSVSRGSTTGLRPRSISSTFSGSTSTPVTE